MKKLLLPSIAALVALSACQLTPTPAASYKGVWGWATVNLSTGSILDKGAVILSDEINGTYGTVAGGAYLNERQTISGVTVLGPMTGSGALETAFSYGTGSPIKFNFIAADDDNALEIVQGYPTFAGAGVTFDANNNPLQNIGVVLVQTSVNVPAALGQQAAAKLNAAQMASQAGQQYAFNAKSRLKAAGIKLNSSTLMNELR